jgi:uncharacterized protein (TIGR02996 family)
MASVLSILSKHVFEKLAPGAKVGEVLAIASYTGTRGALARLEEGGSLYLVTVRPEDRLWLVAVLEDPYLEEGGWHAQLNTLPVADVTSCLADLRFESGGGVALDDLAQSLKTPRVLTSEDEALLRGTQATPRTTLETEAELLAQVLAAPEDDAARAVLADWYLERGDVRGEVLLRPAAVSAHERALLGDLYVTTREREWDRGLLHRITLASEHAAEPEVWMRAAQHPQLRTVRHIDRGSSKPERFRSFLASPSLPPLAQVSVWEPRTFECVVERARPHLTTLVLEYPTAAMRARLEDLDLLPALHRLTLVVNEGSDPDALVETWTSFVRPDVDVVLRLPSFYDGRGTAHRAVLFRWR